MILLSRQGGPIEVREAPPIIYPHNGLADLRVDSAIHRHVLQVLEYTGGDYAWAAEELQVNVVTLRRWIDKWRVPAIVEEREEAYA